jgi:hypothetical protein
MKTALVGGRQEEHVEALDEGPVVRVYDVVHQPLADAIVADSGTGVLANP